jgi:mercuric ion binding protein
MFRALSILVALSILSLAAMPSARSADERTAEFKIENMTCAACPVTVSAAMKRVNGVLHVHVDPDAKIAKVTFDAEKTSPNEIGAASSDAGFPATLAAGNAL